MAAEIHPGEYIGTFIDAVMVDLRAEISGNIISAISPYIGGVAGIYLLGLCVLAFFGDRDAMRSLPMTVFKIAIVSAVALNYENLQYWILAPTDAFLKLMTGAVSGSDSLTVYDSADAAINRSMEVAVQALEKVGDAGMWDWEIIIAWTLAGLFAFAGGMVMILPSMLGIIAAKATIDIAFMISPLFIVAGMFPYTTKYLNGWIAGVANAIVSIWLLALIMSLSTLMTSKMMGDLDIADGGAGPWSVVGMSIALAFALWAIINRMWNFASTLAGGISMSMPVTGSRVGQASNYLAKTLPMKAAAGAGRLILPTRSGGSVRRSN